MTFSNATRVFTARALGVVLLSAAFLLPLAGCDLSKNYLKADRSSDMEIQDYRDALAPRMPDVKEPVVDEASIPELKPFMATPSDKLKPMPLVSVSVNQTVPLKDVLYQIAEQADYDIELDPRIKGSIIFSARNRPFDQVLDRIAESSGLRYKFDNDTVRVELDTPYHQTYKINYLNYVRTNSSSISNDVAVVSGEGTDTGSKFKADANSEANFWTELDANLTQILGAYRDAATLRTKKDPKLTAVADSAAPVEPVVLSANGELAQQGTTPDGTPAPTVQVAAPNAVLRVEPLPVDEEEDTAPTGTDDPFAARYSVNKQAGIVSVFASERAQKKIAEYLDILRRSVTSQVLIEAKVLEVALKDEFSAGVDWSAVNLFGEMIDGSPITNIGTVAGGVVAPGFTPAPAAPLSLVLGYSKGDFNAAVNAMSRFGTVHALASPRLTVLNNQSAVLNVAKNVVYFELDVTTNTTDAGTTTDIDSNIRNVPEGVLINVQPSIDLDNNVISMAVRPTVTRVLDYVNDPGVSYAVATNPDIPANVASTLISPVPVVNVQEFDSVLQMNNGQPVVLGGLIQDRTDSTQNAVPVLGELPLIGAAFRNQIDSVQKTELVVMLKATIIDGSNSTIHNTDKDLYRGFGQDRRPFDL